LQTKNQIFLLWKPPISVVTLGEPEKTSFRSSKTGGISPYIPEDGFHVCSRPISLKNMILHDPPQSRLKHPFYVVLAISNDGIIWVWINTY
jgi:hypothetical protein